MELAVNTAFGPQSASLDIVLLRTFVAVIELGGFAPAAERLALTPSAVSGHIKRLEDSAGTRLLERTTRRVAATPAGETLHRYARNILDLEREALARLKGSSIQGRLRVGASEDFAGTWLPGVLQAFQRGYPDAAIELKVGITPDLVRQLARGRLDIVFGKQCGPIDRDGELLWEEPLVWAYAEQAPFSSDTIVPLAAFAAPCIYRDAAVTALGESEREWRLAFESSSMAGCLSAALSGFAVAPVARSQLRPGLRALGRREGMPALPQVRFYAFIGKRTPATLALVRAVHEAGSPGRFAPRNAA
ncbi:LysR substrate-binding domain-containing protein [Burkholderia gladioli]|uniref:LysR family transcriptional regulator n=1 Tax=Burkholderia gladioli TaxID=28095 RepID=A0A2A7SE33_BURGA|nr:LysR substrate-binding domain-containing protein [Burkholderia gladioli]MBJ9677492.1 LysR family transcriptional regulator [Burkholderia gladioli]MBU9171229.1 LysR family transcriptional regulator [Burkholderia gladioli]MBU9195320.1 LysR family transcriptional regulator [Burkholderia gladioli]MBU9422078.1 LysR family transcriptional regulator [Burkholderia gladioli]MDN7459621.1 LysR substrate-binding domain-containing protein [Burkholderia gladioli]